MPSFSEKVTRKARKVWNKASNSASNIPPHPTQNGSLKPDGIPDNDIEGKSSKSAEMEDLSLRPKVQRKTISDLPLDIILEICKYLTISEQASLALVSRTLYLNSSHSINQTPELMLRNPVTPIHFEETHIRENFLKWLDDDCKDTKIIYCTDCKMFHDPMKTIGSESLRVFPDESTTNAIYIDIKPKQELAPCVEVALERYQRENDLHNSPKFPFLAIQTVMKEHRLGNINAVNKLLRTLSERAVRSFAQETDPPQDFGPWTLPDAGGTWFIKSHVEFKIVDGNLLLKRQQIAQFHNRDSEFPTLVPSGLKILFCPHHEWMQLRCWGKFSPSALTDETFESLKRAHKRIRKTGHTSLDKTSLVQHGLCGTDCNNCPDSSVRSCETCQTRCDVTGRLLGGANFEMTFTAWQSLGKGLHPLEDGWIIATSSDAKMVWRKKEERKGAMLGRLKLLMQLGSGYNDQRNGVDDARRLFGDACFSCGALLEISAAEYSADRVFAAVKKLCSTCLLKTDNPPLYSEIARRRIR